MGPMISGGIIAQERELDPELVTLMLGVGIPLSFFTVTLASFFLGGGTLTP
jgi:malate permease and related proteins